MKLSRAALRPLLASHERGALPLVGAAWGVTARKSSHNGVMPGVTLRARWDATLVLLNLSYSMKIIDGLCHVEYIFLLHFRVRISLGGKLSQASRSLLQA